MKINKTLAVKREPEPIGSIATGNLVWHRRTSAFFGVHQLDVITIKLYNIVNASACTCQVVRIRGRNMLTTHGNFIDGDDDDDDGKAVAFTFIRTQFTTFQSPLFLLCLCLISFD